jgi:hypothetical protein
VVTFLGCNDKKPGKKFGVMAHGTTRFSAIGRIFSPVTDDAKNAIAKAKTRYKFFADRPFLPGNRVKAWFTGCAGRTSFPK